MSKEIPNTRVEFSRVIANKYQLEQEIVDTILVDFLEQLTKSVASGAYVQLRPYFTAHAVLRKGKKVRNITKGITFDIPDWYKPVFKPSKEFMTLTNNLMGGGEK